MRGKVNIKDACCFWHGPSEVESAGFRVTPHLDLGACIAVAPSLQYQYIPCLPSLPPPNAPTNSYTLSSDFPNWVGAENICCNYNQQPLSQSFLMVVKRKGKRKEMYENNDLKLFYCQPRFSEILVTKPEMVAYSPGMNTAPSCFSSVSSSV